MCSEKVARCLNRPLLIWYKASCVLSLHNENPGPLLLEVSAFCVPSSLLKSLSPAVTGNHTGLTLSPFSSIFVSLSFVLLLLHSLSPFYSLCLSALP